MKLDNLININKKLGVSTKWVYLEGFISIRGKQKVEVYKFGEASDYDAFFEEDNISDLNSYYKSQEISEKMRGFMSKTHFVIHIYEKGCEVIKKKFFISTNTYNSEKYPHHVEDILIWLRSHINTKYLYWELEKYFRMEEYESYWNIFPIYFDEDYGICGGVTYTPPIFKKYVKEITEERVDIDHLLYSNIYFKIPEGIPGRYNYPINCTLYISSVDIIYKTLKGWDRYYGKRPDDWEDVIKNIFKGIIDSKINDIKIYDERRKSRRSDFDILPHQMRKEIKDFLYTLYKIVLKRAEEKLANAQNLLTCENEKDMLYNFEKQIDTSPERKDSLTFRVENHKINLLDYGDKEKLKKIIPARLTHWSDEYSILIENPRNTNTFIGFSFYKDSLKKACDYTGKTVYEIIKDMLLIKETSYILDVWGEEVDENFRYKVFILNPEYPEIGLKVEIEELSTLRDRGYQFFDSSNIDEICNILEENKVFDNIKGDAKNE